MMRKTFAAASFLLIKLRDGMQPENDNMFSTMSMQLQNQMRGQNIIIIMVFTCYTVGRIVVPRHSQ